MPSPDPELPIHKRWFAALQQRPVVAVVLFATAIVTGVAGWADSLKKIRDFIQTTPTPTSAQTPVPPPSAPSVQVNQEVTFQPTIEVNTTGLAAAPSATSSTQTTKARPAQSSNACRSLQRELDKTEKLLAASHQDFFPYLEIKQPDDVMTVHGSIGGMKRRLEQLGESKLKLLEALAAARC